MVENKKIKLPPPLQLDSVSPATRLLEKRRLMYEVQKAFEDQKKEFEKEEKRCRVREKELREKDILIQDNLIRFSTHLSQADNKKTQQIALAKIEKEKIEEKEREILMAEQRLAALEAQHTRITKKMDKLQKFEDFLKDVQQKYADEFTDLSEIDTRYRRLSDTNKVLKMRHVESGVQAENTTKNMELYKKQNEAVAIQKTNEIVVVQKKLISIEEQKSELIKGNEKQSEQLLKKTSEQGTLLMSIDSIYKKISTKNAQNFYEINFIQHLPQINNEDGGAKPENAFLPENCKKELDVIRTYIEAFDTFREELNKTITDSQGKTKETYFQRMLGVLEKHENQKFVDEIDTFTSLNPDHLVNR